MNGLVEEATPVQGLAKLTLLSMNNYEHCCNLASDSRLTDMSSSMFVTCKNERPSE